jgi:uncharacterized membrane protein
MPARTAWQARVNERRVRAVFQLSVLLKGAHATLECVSGLVLAFVSTTAVTDFVSALTQHELAARPRDAVARWLFAQAQDFSIETKHFYAFYLLSHGIVKLLLVVALLRGRLWSYPAALIVFGLFIAYQLHRFAYTHSAGLLALTAFDAVVMALIWHEYRLVRRHLPARG